MKEKGFGLIELLAVASILSVALLSITGLMSSSLRAEQEERIDIERQNKVQSLIEITRAIYQSGWEGIATNGEYHPILAGGHWSLAPGADSTDPELIQSITISSVFRGGQAGGIGVGDIVESGGYEDFDTKRVTARVVTPEGEHQTSTYLSRWQSRDWIQTDWSGGAGQANWSDPTRYAADDGHLRENVSGQLTLEQGSGSCSTATWTFDNAADYLFADDQIEVAGGNASLLPVSGGQDANTLALWRLDDPSEIFADASTRENHLDVSGKNNKPTFGAAGKFGTAVAFDGNNDFGSLADNKQSGLEGMAALTLDAWVNPSLLNGTMDIVSKWWDGNPSWDQSKRSYRLYLASDGSLNVELNNGWTGVTTKTNSGAIQAGQWTHVAAVYDGSRVALYVNGQLANTPVNYSSGIGNGNALVYLSGAGSLSFNGRLDEVRISNVARWTSSFPLPTQPAGETAFPTTRPSLRPATSYSPGPVHGWANFTETASKGNGEIYYQLSLDNGATWIYWDGAGWSNADTENYTTAEQINAHLDSLPVTSDRILFRAFLSSDGEQDVTLDAVSIACRPFQMAVGQVSTDEQWASVQLSVAFNDPVVVGSYLESANTLPASVRIRNVHSTGFDIRLQHPSGQDLQSDQISYLVVERGIWRVGGQLLEAGKLDTDKVGRRGSWIYETVNFQVLPDDPIVLHQVMSYNDPNWITTYVSRSNSQSNPPRNDGMRIALNGAEAVTSHGTETIGWVAMARGRSGNVGGSQFESLRAPDKARGHDDSCLRINYAQSYASTPIVLSTQLEMDETDGGWAVTCNTTNATSAFIHIEEDQERDTERSHTTETVGFFAFATPFTYTVSSGGVAASGWLNSSTLDTGSSSTVYNQIAFMGVEPSGTEIRLQIATNNDNSTWSYLGPDGTNNTYYTQGAGQAITYSAHALERYVRYRVWLHTSVPADSPVLDEVILNYSP